MCCFSFTMTSNRNNNYQDVNASRTASMQANLQIEFRARYFNNFLQSCSVLHNAGIDMRWHSQLLRVTILQVSKEESKKPHEEKALSLKKSLQDTPPNSPDQQMFLLPMLSLHVSLLKMTGENSPSVVTQCVQMPIHNSKFFNSCSA